MEAFDPVVQYQIKVGREVLPFGMNSNAASLSRDCSGDTHNHSRFELHMILEGSFQMDVEGVSHRLTAGQAVLVAPGQYHRAVKLSDHFLRLTVGMTPQGEALHSAMLEVIARCCIFDLPSHMLDICRSILDESERKSDFYLELMRVKMTELVIAFLRLCDLREENSQNEEQTAIRPHDIIDNYFENNMCNSPSADELAGLLHISRRHLNRVLQSFYGVGFREKLLLARMDRAKWLLRHTEESVSVIAGEVGYTYDSAFRQAFFRHFGMTPQAYRLQQKRKKERTHEP